MVRRGLLRKQLRAAWHKTILGAYSSQLINSERGLQVHFCIALLHEFESSATRRLFIEPKVVFSDGEKRYPDVVICNRDRIIGVVELKYKPRGRPSVEKDVNTLVRIRQARGKITLANDRYKGPLKSKSYPLAEDAILCWGGIYAGEAVKLPAQNIAELGDRFERLDAFTSKNANPEL